MTVTTQMSLTLHMQCICPSSTTSCKTNKLFIRKSMTFACSMFCISSITYNSTVQLAAQAGMLLFFLKEGRN